MKWGKATTTKDHNARIPENWLYLHYYEAITILFRIENSLRLFVFIVLKNALKEEWLNVNILSEGSDANSISSISKKRKAQASQFGYLGYNISCPLMFLATGELIELIISDAYWKYFASFFSGTKLIIKNKFDEINNIRNSLAHFRPIKEDDLDLIKQNAKHVMTLIENCICDLLTCKNVVPTNTTELWYKELKPLGNDNIKISFKQSDSESWVVIKMLYNCPIISQKKWSDDYINYTVLNILPASILKISPLLTNNIILLSEEIPYTQMKQNLSPEFQKSISFFFSRKALIANYKDIKIQFEAILNKIATETEEIKQDNLAKGEIIESVKTNAAYTEYENSEGESDGYWSIRTNALTCDVKENDPPEYWGAFTIVDSDFISNTNKFPWMPVEISEIELPF